MGGVNLCLQLFFNTATRRRGDVSLLPHLLSALRNIGADSLKTKLRGLSPRANYTDRATADCRRSDCQLLRIEGATWSA
jgi:hypothetical protein